MAISAYRTPHAAPLGTRFSIRSVETTTIVTTTTAVLEGDKSDFLVLYSKAHALARALPGSSYGILLIAKHYGVCKTCLH